MEGPEWEYPYANGLALLEGLVWGAGAERVMWGTDWPWTDGRCTYKQNLAMDSTHADFLSDEDNRLVLGVNAATFAGLSVD